MIKVVYWYQWNDWLRHVFKKEGVNKTCVTFFFFREAIDYNRPHHIN